MLKKISIGLSINIFIKTKGFKMTTKKLTIQHAQEVAKKKNGRCLSSDYINSGKKLLFECSKGHQFSARYRDVKHKNSWCVCVYIECLYVCECVVHFFMCYIYIYFFVLHNRTTQLLREDKYMCVCAYIVCVYV